MPAWIEDRMLDKDEVADVTKLSASTIEEQVRQGSFPKPRVISKKRTAWLASEVVEWMRERPASERKVPLRQTRSPVTAAGAGRALAVSLRVMTLAASAARASATRLRASARMGSLLRPGVQQQLHVVHMPVSASSQLLISLCALLE